MSDMRRHPEAGSTGLSRCAAERLATAAKHFKKQLLAEVVQKTVTAVSPNAEVRAEVIALSCVLGCVRTGLRTGFASSPPAWARLRTPPTCDLAVGPAGFMLNPLLQTVVDSSIKAASGASGHSVLR
jgi:hypothetical protein